MRFAGAGDTPLRCGLGAIAEASLPAGYAGGVGARLRAMTWAHRFLTVEAAEGIAPAEASDEWAWACR